MRKSIRGLGVVLLLSTSLLCVAQTAPAGAPQAATGFQFNGAGTMACKDVQPLLANPNTSPQFEQWMWGFLAAYNAYASPALRVSLPQPQALVAYASDVCKANPNIRFISVVGSALQQLGARVPALQ